MHPTNFWINRGPWPTWSSAPMTLTDCYCHDDVWRQFFNANVRRAVYGRFRDSWFAQNTLQTITDAGIGGLLLLLLLWLREINCQSAYDACRATAADLISATAVYSTRRQQLGEVCLHGRTVRRALMFNSRAIRVHVDGCTVVHGSLSGHETIERQLRFYGLRGKPR